VYEVVIEPWITLAGRTSDFKIFQNKSALVSCPLSGSASLLNFNPVFSKSSLVGLDFEGVCARLVCCVVPVLLPIQTFTQASALSGADSLS
jgi:hypothetical protein